MIAVSPVGFEADFQTLSEETRRSTSVSHFGSRQLADSVCCLLVVCPGAVVKLGKGEKDFNHGLWAFGAVRLLLLKLLNVARCHGP